MAPCPLLVAATHTQSPAGIDLATAPFTPTACGPRGPHGRDHRVDVAQWSAGVVNFMIARNATTGGFSALYTQSTIVGNMIFATAVG